jgi:hypothetical protein
MPGSLALVLLATLAAEPAVPETAVPTHLGETGYLDVPVAESQGIGGAAFAIDLRYLRADDVNRAVAPSPLVMSFGLGRAEAGFSLRQGGLPGDARPYATVPAGAGKFSIFEAKGKRPALAIDLLLDHINRTPTTHLRAIATSQRIWRTRATAFAGGVLGFDRPSGWTAGAALSVTGPRQTEFMVEGLRQPGGLLAGAAIRWLPVPQLALGLGASYLPDDARTLLAGVTVAFLHRAPARSARATEAETAPEDAKPKTGKRVFTTERPRFPLELRQRPMPAAEGGPAPHYPGNAAASAEPAPQEKPAVEAKSATAEPAEAVEVIKAETPDDGATTLPVMRGNRIVQRRVIDSVIITLRTARSAPKGSERDAIKKLAIRSAAGEGDLMVWATTIGSDANKLLSAVGRAVAVKRLAAKLARLRKNNFGIQIGPGEPAARNRVMVALLAPDQGAAAEAARPQRAGGKGKPGVPSAAQPLAPPPPAAAAPAIPVEPPPATKPARQSQLLPEGRTDAGVPAARVEPPVKAADHRDAGAATPDALPDAPPARVERLVPLPPTLKEGAGGESQVRRAVASFQPALKECVDRALKRDPSLRGEGNIDLDVRSIGRVKLVAIHSKTLAGGWFEDCVRRAANAWRMPRTPEGYHVSIPLKLHIGGGGSP